MRELSLHILDIAQNSFEAGADTVVLRIGEDSRRDRLEIEIEDNGHGMSEETVRIVTDPFVTSRKTRRVGLGIPLFAAAAERCNGHFEIESELGTGTKVKAVFQLSHIDRAPLGDMASTLISMLLQDPPVRIVYRHQVDDRCFEVDTSELIAELGGLSLSNPPVLRWLRGYLSEGFANLYGGSAYAYD